MRSWGVLGGSVENNTVINEDKQTYAAVRLDECSHVAVEDDDFRGMFRGSVVHAPNGMGLSHAVDNLGGSDAVATPPTDPRPGTRHSDDGANRADGTLGYRYSDGTSWNDLCHSADMKNALCCRGLTIALCLISNTPAGW